MFGGEYRKMDINKFLKKENTEPDVKKDNFQNLERWYELIRPATVNIILGRKGAGKSALGYFLLEYVGAHYDLSPFIVNLPDKKAALLAGNFASTNLTQVKTAMNSIILIDEGTTMLPAGRAKLEEMIKAFVALSRQRNQVIIFVFHASSDVGSRILRGVDAVLLKEPSKRQIQHGSKDNWWHDLLLESKDKFRTIADMGKDKREYTYVDSEEPEYRGLLLNPLCSFWSEDLSCAYAGVVEREGDRLIVSDQLKLSALLQRTDEDDQSNTMKRLARVESLFWPKPIPYDKIIEYDMQFNLEELRQQCRDAGLSISGDKKMLAAKLIAKGKVAK